MNQHVDSGADHRATVRDVARLAGVSAMTVSRALNTPGRVQADTLERVKAAILETRYVPNLVAGSLRTRKSRVVAAIVPAMDSPVFDDTLQAMTAELATRGYHLMLGQGGYCLDGEEAVLQAFLARRPDGVVLVGVDHTTGARASLLGSGIPVVETWDFTEEPIDLVVGFSHAKVGETVCRFLFGKGRRRLAVVSGKDARARRRAESFVECAKDLGVDVVELETGSPTTLGNGREALRELMRASPTVDGIFCSSDMMALGVLIEATNQCIQVPESLSVVGFGNLPFAAATQPALTTVTVDGRRIGIEAARCVMQRIAHPSSEPPAPMDVGFSIVERGST